MSPSSPDGVTGLRPQPDLTLVHVPSCASGPIRTEVNTLESQTLLEYFSAMDDYVDAN